MCIYSGEVIVQLQIEATRFHVQLPIHHLSPALEVAGLLLECVRVGVGWKEGTTVDKLPVQWYIIITIHCAFLSYCSTCFLALKLLFPA